jgi:hypothetical protein
MSSSIVQSFQQLPRALKWAVLAAFGLVLFLIWDNYLRDVSDDLNRQADAIESQVAQVRSVGKLSDSAARVIEAVGPVEFPRPEAETSAAVDALVISLLTKHGATNPNFSLRTKGLLPKKTLEEVLGGKRLERLAGDLKFEASPKAAAAIIAELEASPDVETVNSVRISRTTPGKVQVQLTIEAWVLSSEQNVRATL